MQSIRLFVLIAFSLFVFVPIVHAERIEQAALKQSVLDDVLLLDIVRVGERLVAAGEQGTIIFSDDGGVSWSQANVPSSTLITSMHFFDNQQGWAVGHDGIVLVTKDSGESWKLQLDGKVINRLRVAAIRKELKRLTASSYELEEGSVDEVEQLEYLLEDALLALKEGPSTPLLDVLFLDAIKGYVVGAYGLFLETGDGGETWTYRGHQLSNDDGFHINKLYHTKNGALFLLGEAGLFMLSDDEGHHWDVADQPYSGSLFSIMEADGLYLMGLRGNVFYKPRNQIQGEDASIAIESKWEKIKLDVTSTINDSVLVKERLYLAGQDGVLLRQNGRRFESFNKRGLRSYSAMTFIDSHLILVGEGGVSRIALNKGDE